MIAGPIEDPVILVITAPRYICDPSALGYDTPNQVFENCGRNWVRTSDPSLVRREYGTDYAQLCALVHALELRKPCPEMSQGAWSSLHGGSRKWFPEQSADPSPKERVEVGLPACRTSIIRSL